jgi:tight adherence protein C
MTVLLGAAWAGVVLLFGWQHRPAPARVRTLARRAVPRTAPSAPARLWLGAAERIGHRVLTLFRRDPAPAEARRAGLAVVAAAAFLPLLPLAAGPVAALIWAAPGVLARRADRRRLAELAADLPDVVDLLVLAVGAGLTVHLALIRVSARVSGPLAAELRRTVEEAALGRRLADALDDLPARAGESMRPLVAALVASERYGAPLVAGLERLSDEVRRDRRRRAEEAVRKVPVKLLFPLVTCTLPAFGLLTVAPLVASAIRSLRL